MIASKDPRLRRIYAEAALVAACRRYSRTGRAKVDLDEGKWVLIADFPLPDGFNRAATDILILLPSRYPETPPDWFYLDRGLRRIGGESLLDRLVGGKLPHYFETARAGLSANGWAGGCLHIRSWKPTNDPLTGHSLLSVCELIHGAFGRWLRN